MTSDQATVARFLKSARVKPALELPVLSPAPAKPTKVVLDMGEGSREQGFALNGCR